MDGTSLELPLLIAATFAGALVAGMSGFAFGLIAASIWPYILAPLQTASLMIVASSCSATSARVSSARSCWCCC